jgi:hypothetical protein
MNMSYCRFENTYNDLIDCIENMSKESSNDRDERYRERLLLLMKNTVDSGEVDDILEEIEDNKHK